MTRLTLRLLWVIPTLLLCACSPTVNSYVDSISLAFSTPQDVVLTEQDLQEGGPEAIYVRRDQGAQLVLVLQSKQANGEFWKSADSGILQFSGNRLVQTAGFAENLLDTRGQGLRQLEAVTLQSAEQQQRQWQTDWSVAEHSGFAASSVISKRSVDTLRLWETEFKTIRLDEQVSFADGTVLTNRYWFDAQSGDLLRTIQQPAPFWHEMDVTFISKAWQLKRSRL